MKHTNLFTIITKLIVIIMPFYVLWAVFLENIWHIPKAWFFIKELLIIMLFFSLIYEYIKQKKVPRFDVLDYLVFAFVIYGVAITFVNGLWLKSIIFGGRYDFMFLIVMVIYKHSNTFLKVKTNKLIQLFLFSGLASLFFWIVFKFTMKEEYLINFWFVNYVGNWVYSWGVPNYHGLEGTGIRRFQWILDGPNPMAYFLIIFSGFYIYLQKNKKEYYVILSAFLLFILLFLTYSRSALLWVGFAVLLLFSLQAKFLYKNYKKYLYAFLIFTSLFWVTIGFIFQDSLKSIVLRHGSTSGHFERMKVGIKRFTKKPMWAWLAESGPAYRAIYPEKQTAKDEVFYIPESWYIQLLVEWWILYLWVFLSILYIILSSLFRTSKTLFAMFIAILIMNVFLHIFEASYLSILLFIFIWLFLKEDYYKKDNFIS